MANQHFPYRIDPRWAPFLFLLLGVRQKDGVTIENGEVLATFGRYQVKTTLDNIKGSQVDGPHRWYTAVGLRLSGTDDSITFGTNHYKGVTIFFVNKIAKVIGFKDHSMLWVSPADPEGLSAALKK